MNNVLKFVLSDGPNIETVYCFSIFRKKTFFPFNIFVFSLVSGTKIEKVEKTCKKILGTKLLLCFEDKFLRGHIKSFWPQPRRIEQSKSKNFPDCVFLSYIGVNEIKFKSNMYKFSFCLLKVSKTFFKFILTNFTSLQLINRSSSVDNNGS